MTVSNVSPLPEQTQITSVSDQAVAGTQDISAPSGISTLAQLRETSKPLYDAIMESMAYQICTKQKDSVDRIKKILDEAERNKK